MSLNFLFGEEDQIKEGIVLVDLSQIALATVMHTFDEKEKITIPMMRHLVLNTLRYNVLKFRRDGYTKIVICVDNAKEGYWRRDFAYYYKKNRAGDREKSDWDWDGYFEGLHTVVQELKDNMPYTVIDITKAEADDGIGVLTKRFSLDGHPVLIVSSDGDFTQLHKFPNVKQWSPMQKKFVTPKNGSPAMDLMIKIIKGDRKDCVAGVKVRSDYWFTFIEGERTPPTKTSFIEQCVDSDEEQLKTLLGNEWYDRFVENRVLIDFDYINPLIAEQINRCYDTYEPAKRGKIYPYFVKSGLSKLTANIGDF
ncbi:hypothetical protein KNT64_gp162 [Pseudomonas phage PspYZU05]|uniref:5'-3' exonuclease domain-containing protein n=1 Tax=Pseudomonas phage PspYZU05 TaxID=1983556 RepID=A0A2U7NJL1_9CAUD|nr:hypothetical protein KNT64_gp162 [Pseudomonas phage PspYZU05]ASD52114.1 hypothetical protein PspYZU05_162 [Pseudomonas phage PspYZU05]